MALIIEDGTGVANANSYVSEAELQAYADARGIVLAGSLEQRLILAMDYIESLSYIGYKKDCDQPLAWPRCNAYYDYCFCAEYLDGHTIPKELKNGQMEAAIAISQGNDPLQDQPRATKREKVGDLEVEYMDGASATVVNKRIMTSLQRLLVGAGYQLPVRKG